MSRRSKFGVSRCHMPFVTRCGSTDASLLRIRVGTSDGEATDRKSAAEAARLLDETARPHGTSGVGVGGRKQ